MPSLENHQMIMKKDRTLPQHLQNHLLGSVLEAVMILILLDIIAEEVHLHHNKCTMIPMVMEIIHHHHVVVVVEEEVDTHL